MVRIARRKIRVSNYLSSFRLAADGFTFRIEPGSGLGRGVLLDPAQHLPSVMLPVVSDD